MKRKYIAYFIFVTFFLYLFVVYDVNFHGPDEPIYFAYTASVVEDSDLNVANQIDLKHYPHYLTSGKFGVSKTYNLADFHNHAGVILWAPFYVYAKSIYYIAAKLNLKGLSFNGLDKVTKCAMSFSTIVFGFLALILTYKLCRVFFSNKTAIWSTLAIFLGTPFFYFILYEVGNSNMVGCLFSILSIWFCSYAIAMKRSHWFLYGLFFSICVMIKSELCFQIFFILFIFITFAILKQTRWRNGVYFFVGITLGFIPRIINDYLKYGTLHVGELNLFNFRNSYFLEQLFSSYHGFFYTSPIFYICLLGFILLVANLSKNVKNINEKKIQEIFLLALTSYLFIKIFILSFRCVWGGGTPGARILLTEFPVFVLLFAHVFQGQRKYIKYFLGIASILFILWNWLIISEYMMGVDLKYITGAPKLGARIATIKNILPPLFYIKDIDIKLKSCLPLLPIVFGMTFYITERFRETNFPVLGYVRSQDRHRSFNTFVLITIYLYTAYTVITVLNIYNNKRNVEKLKADGFFENAKIIGPNEFEKEEVVGSLNEMIDYFESRGDTDRVNKIKSYKKEIYGEMDK
ncbi:MAG: glycosyltransferase family 39 protein [Candidatus Omnitrophota bacterium]|nr:glycosyltransferase family 39 protein [Candidatus Omnitrophota bacterium]